MGARQVIATRHNQCSREVQAQGFAKRFVNSGRIAPLGLCNVQIGQTNAVHPAGGFENGRQNVGAVHAARRDVGRQAQTRTLRTNGIDYRRHHFFQKAQSVVTRATIGIAAQVGCRAQKLVNQVAVGAVNFHAIKTRSDGIQGSLAKVGHHLRDFIGFKRAGRGAIDHASVASSVRCQPDLSFKRHSRRCHRQRATMKVRVRHAPGVPDLQEYLATFGMHRLSHQLPAVNLRGGINAWRVGITLALRRNVGGLGNHQAGRSALAIVLGHHGIRHVARLGASGAGQRRHDYAVGKLEGTQRVGLEQGGRSCHVNFQKKQ